MEEKDPLKGNEEKSLNLTIYKPEDQIFQKLHLCQYLGELPEMSEDKNEGINELKP